MWSQLTPINTSSAHLATHIIQKDPSPTVLDYASAAFVQMTPQFNKRCDELAEYLKKSGYKEKLWSSVRSTKLIKQVPRDQALKPSVPKNKCNQGIPFVITYNPASPNLNKIISKHFPIRLQSSNRCKEAFSEKPFIAYRRPRNLRNFLVKAKVKNIQTQTSPPRIKK